MNIELISWNVNGIVPNNIEKSKSIVQLLDEYHPDLFLIQEAKVKGLADFVNKMDIIYPRWNEDYFVNVNSTRGYSGTITMIGGLGEISKHYNLTLPVSPEFDNYNNNRIILTIIGNDLAIFNVYIPNSGCGLVRMEFKHQWMQEFTNLVQKTINEYKRVIVLGDVNVVPGREDIKNYNANHNKAAGCTDNETEYYNQFLSATGMKDIAVELGKRSEYTFFGQFPKRNKAYNAGWRLDHCWITPNIKINHYEVLKHIEGSDHCPLFISIDYDD